MTGIETDGYLRRDEVEEIRRTFFDQARQALDAIDEGLLALEGQLPTSERLAPLRRAAHTLKGDCGSVGFPTLSTLAHALEDGLAALEASGTPLTGADCDSLLGAADGLRAGLRAGLADVPVPDVGLLIEDLRDVGRGRGPRARSSPGTAPVRGPSRPRTVRLSLAFSGVRRATRRVRELLSRIGLELVTPLPPVAPAGVRLELTAVGPVDVAELEARLGAIRGIDARVELEPDPPGLGPAAAAPRAAEAWSPGLSPRPTPLDPRLPEAREGETVRVEARRVDDVLNLVGEMVVARSIIAGVAAEIEALLPEEQGQRLIEAQSLLARVLQDLQRSAMRMRMVPADRVFRRFARVVRDLGRSRDKSVALRIVGESTELDRGIIDALEEPLLHLVRNAVDHGIEAVGQRRAAGKPEQARLVLRAGREGNHVVIEVADDGRGIDTAGVRARALERGLISPREAETMGDEDAAQLVFEPGLSTATEVTETSGRGVGLDVVRRTVESLKGSVRVSAASGGGTSFVIRVPLTVAIIQALLFRAGGRDLAVPLTSVVEIALPAELAVQRVDNRHVFRLRNEVLDLVSAGGLLGIPHGDGGPGFVIVVQDGARRFGMLVDELVGEQELVIKAVHDQWVRTPLVAGASVLGDGRLVLILDVPSVYRAALARGGGAA